MDLVIKDLLTTRITFLPELFETHFQIKYSNGMCNLATWFLVVWTVLHLCFDKCLNVIFSKLKVSKLLGLKGRHYLWYLSCNFLICTYCISILCYEYENGVASWLQILLNNRNISTESFTSILLTTFFVHCALWEISNFCNYGSVSSYICLSILLFCFQIFRSHIQIYYLMIFTSFTEIPLHMMNFIILFQGSSSSIQLATKIIYWIYMFCFFVNYFCLIPIYVGYSLIHDQTLVNINTVLLFLCVWFVTKIFSSALFKCIFHWKKHGIKEKNCKTDIINCSLCIEFCDSAKHFAEMEKEIDERLQRTKSLMKPKTKHVVFQTLKCMVAIKRKLKQKHRKSEPVLTESDADTEVANEINSVENTTNM